MKRYLLFISSLLLFVFTIHGQIGIGTTTPSSGAKLDIVNSSQGVLFPRMTSGERDIAPSLFPIKQFHSPGAALPNL